MWTITHSRCKRRGIVELWTSSFAIYVLVLFIKTILTHPSTLWYSDIFPDKICCSSHWKYYHNQLKLLVQLQERWVTTDWTGYYFFVFTVRLTDTFYSDIISFNRPDIIKYLVYIINVSFDWYSADSLTFKISITLASI